MTHEHLARPARPARPAHLAHRPGRFLAVALGLALAGLACSGSGSGTRAGGGGGDQTEPPSMSAQGASIPDNAAVAVFAGGCFWCMESALEETKGVVRVTSGYTGGSEERPTYEQVSSGRTGHREAVRVLYDPAKISYRKLLDVFWRQIDPTDPGGQFADQGPQYRTAIFVRNEEERKQAEASKAALAASGRFKKPIVTEILPAGPFHAAEDYHQDYYKKNPGHYKAYRVGSGREGFLARTWGNTRKHLESPESRPEPGTETRPARKYTKPGDAELRRRLTPLQYQVTQQAGTERPFHNTYWNNHRAGIYVDIVSGEPLFSSLDKFESGTGWPSFTRPLVAENIVKREDHELLAARTEVRSKAANSHLGHVFHDGPKPTRLRYCMNSAALRFVPVEKLEKEGYGRFLPLFKAR